MAGGTEMMFELDGGGVAPENVDTLLLLRLASAWFGLAAKVASANKIKLRMTGLHIRDKCVAVETVVNNTAAARRVNAKILRILADKDEVPAGASAEVKELLAWLKDIPENQHASVRVGDSWTKKVAVVLHEEAAQPWETTELRVQPIRVGGERHDRAKLVSASERGPFSVDVTQDQARELGALLHREVDLELRIKRGADGLIRQGRVAAIHRLAKGSAQELREWFAPHAAAWAEVKDVEAELGRRD